MTPTTQIRALWITVIALAALTGLSFFRTASLPAEISVERLNIVEPDGQLAWVLANSQRPAPATIGGEVLVDGQEEERRGVPSMLFFDGQGDEVGGMLMGVRETPGGYSAVRHLSLDAYEGDQTVQLVHYQDPGGSRSGLIINDRPATIPEIFDELGVSLGVTADELDDAIANLPEEDLEARLGALFGASRLFVGATREGEATLILNDREGRARIVLSVPEEGEPSIEIRDEEGELLTRLPT